MLSTSAGPEALARDVHRVVAAPVEEPLPVLVDARPVAVAPHAGEPAPVGVQVAFGIAAEPAGHARPGRAAHELADLAGIRHRPVRAEHRDVHPERRAPQRTGFERADRVGGQEARADLGPARQVDDRQPPLADLLEEPPVRLGVPRLARRGEDPQRRQVVGAHRLLARRDQRAHQRGGDPEVRDAVPFHHRPEPVGPGVVRGAVVQEHRRAERRRADDLPRPHDPAEVGEPEQQIAGSDVGLVRDLLGDLDEEPAVDVDGALRRAGGPARVRDEQRVFGIQVGGLEPVRVRREELVPPEVAFGVPRRVRSAQAIHDDHVADRSAPRPPPRPPSPSSGRPCRAAGSRRP